MAELLRNDFHRRYLS